MKRSRRLSLDQLAPNLLQIPTAPGALSPLAIFGDQHPLEIEVGCGKGHFLLEAALAHADVNYLGIEIDRKHQLFAATRMAKRGLQNVRIACADARLFLRDRIPDGCCQALHVYFPDPWWKRKHRKRRVFTEDFARQCARVLAPGGKLLLATDVDEYFKLMIELVKSVPTLVQLMSIVVDPSGRPPVFATNFERKALSIGSPIYRATFQRKNADGSMPQLGARAEPG